ncbi:hypothetical protein B0O99DRAFT_676474 [Bisporella sp. PMI_857]|nr:hypothetical protein B0O99DRAFT_676474 [Bisporella sp. PMI_857]
MAFQARVKANSQPQRSDPNEVLRSIARLLSGTNEYLPLRERARMKKIQPQLWLMHWMNVIQAGDMKLFESLDEIVQRSINVVKVFISSRNDGDIVCRLANSRNIYIDSTLNEEDIERFISIEVTKAIHLKRILGGQVSYYFEKRIVETLSQGAQGMFRWVGLQLRSLCDPRRTKIEADILHEIGHLPRTLAELKKKLISAVAMDNAGGQYIITKDDILNMTCNLLEEDSVLDRFRFAHMSVLEYLESRADYNEEINLLASWRCLDVILKLEPPSTTISHNSIFKTYSDFHALFHYSKVSQPQRIQSLSLRLNTLLPLNKIHQTQFQSPFARWRERMDRMKYTAEAELPDDLMVGGSETPFVAICIFGFSELLTPLVPDHIIQLNQVNTLRRLYNYRGVTGLEIVIRHDRREVVAILLEKGINVGEYTSHGETPLHLACSLGQYEMIQLLLDRGADPNMRSRTSRTKDNWNENRESPSRRISALGFRITQGGLGSTLDEDAEAPIHSAAFTGKADSLVASGADSTVVDFFGQTPYDVAVRYNHDSIAEVLKTQERAGSSQSSPSPWLLRWTEE